MEEYSIRNSDAGEPLEEIAGEPLEEIEEHPEIYQKCHQMNSRDSMKNYTEEEITSLINRFEKRELPKVEWTHEAHLVVAIWYCSKHPLEEALPLARRNITAHNASVGTPNTDTEGYHETITRFWLLVAQHFLKSHGDLSIAERCNAFIRSEYGHSKLPLEFYRPEFLFTPEARHHWQEPDIRPLNSLLKAFGGATARD